MLENVSINLLKVTFKATALCLRDLRSSSRSRVMLDWSWSYLMPFSIPAAKITLHNFERQQSGQKSLILSELADMHEGKTTFGLWSMLWKQQPSLWIYWIVTKSTWKRKRSQYSYGNIKFLSSLLFSIWWKNAHIMLHGRTIAFCPKLCRHNM